MRPEILTLCGLGSYIQEETIDFTGKSFIAVVGDTGAGKSTILEAICYALYNRCTYAGGASPLIADGGNGTMSVEFTFTVGNRRWQVARSASQNTTTSVHRLTCFNTGVVITGAKPVNAEIQRIVGLDYDTFLRAVILPQGRFQELLRMSDRERGQVLDSVLGLEQLVQIRDHAKKLQLRLKDRLVEYQLHRRRFLDDPATALVAATDQHSGHQQRLQRFEQARVAITGARADKQRVTIAADALTAVKDILTAAIPAEAAEQLHTLAVQALTLDGQRNEIGHLVNQLQIEQSMLREQAAQAEQHGGTVAATATAIGALGNLSEQLPQQRKRAQQLARSAAALAAEQAALGKMQKEAAALEPGVATADQIYADVEKILARVQQQHEKAIERLRIWREKVFELETARRELADLERALGVAQDEAGEATRIAGQAEDKREQSEHAHTELLRVNSAAHAAADLEPGAACLICSRPLPADFTPPAAPDLAAAETNRKKARAHAAKTGKEAAVAVARATTLEQKDMPVARQKVTTVERRSGEACLSLQELVAGADLAGSDEQVLAQIVTDTAAAADDLKQAQEKRDKIRAEATAAQTTFDTLSQAHAERDAAHQEQEHQNLELGQTIEDMARGLPAQFTVTMPLDLAEIGRQRDLAEAHQRHLQQLAERQAEDDETLNQLRKRSTDLDQTYATTITRPAARVREKLVTLVQRVADAATAVGRDQPDAVPDVDGTLDRQAQWAADLLAYAQKILDICAAQIDEHRQAEQRAVQAVTLACRAAFAADEEDLEQQYLTTYRTVQNLQQQIQRAQAEIPVACALQERIDTASGIVNALEQLYAALADGKFIAEAVRRRVQALLHQASEILFAISGSRYKFARDFRILDLDTTAERSVKTLSGGETFLASLALALAVVELASNATGHVEALFLDEGFGTLDTTRLRDALNVLTGHSTTGRLVTVISHMRSITENAEHVLVVEKTLTTSRLHWADASEKERIINDDLGRGLLE